MSVQLLIIIAYFLLTIAVGLLATRKSSAASFHGAGLGVMLCVAAGAGEWLGGTSTMGISEYGFLYGISGAWYTLANGIGIIVLAVFFAKLYRSLDTITVPGIVEKFIGIDARIVSSILLTIVMLAVGTSQMISAGALGVSVFGLRFETAVLVLGGGFILYTLAGGMVSVGYVNTLHLITMYAGILLALFFSLRLIGGAETLSTALPERYFSPVGIGGSKISSWIIASVLGACTAQAGIQPILAARDVKTARRAAYLTALVVAPFGILTALLGMTARVALPELLDAKQALPALMMQLSPVVGGLVLAAMFAAVSTVSPIMLACGTLLTKDIYQRRLHPQAGDAQVLRVSRLFTGLAGLACIGLALLLYGETRILDIVYAAYSLRGAIFVVLLFAMYWRRASRRGAVYTMLLTGLTVVFWVVFETLTGQFPLHPGFTETYAAITAASLFSLLFAFLLPNPPGDPHDPVAIRRAALEEAGR